MCGITGFFSPTTFQRQGIDAITQLVENMADQIRHRGPDQGNSWLSEEIGLAFGHRRLSIIDLSPTGSQPMVSSDDSLVICYNGEIYNFLELRRDLEDSGVYFRGTSDTEVLLEGIRKYGFEPMLQRCHGMFALALLDRSENKLILARDRLGEKPLYYGIHGGTLFFASELKCLKFLPDWQDQLNPDALNLYFRHNYIPAPHTIYESVYKLPAGAWISFDLDARIEKTRIDPFARQNEAGNSAAPVYYWQFPDALSRPDQLDFHELGAQDQLEALIKRSVQRQMVADVPVGAFLSGGVDSSTIVALMTEVSSQPVKTFTIGFEEADYNEARDASRVAAHLGTDHHEFTLSATDALDLVPGLNHFYDEPFADSSQLPTLLVSRVTRQHVTVALSGDGGDELFAGYDRYQHCEKLWGYMSGVPRPFRHVLASILQNMPGFMAQPLARFLPGRQEGMLTRSKLSRLSEYLRCGSQDQLYRSLISHDLNPSLLVPGGKEPRYEFSHQADYGDSYLANMMGRDILSYLTDDILAKVDRASMAVSLESRVPLLCQDIISMAWSMKPGSAETNGNLTKYPMRKILYKRVPRELIERPKAGFAIPLGHWLCGPLRDWAEDLLSDERIRNQGILDPTQVSRIKQQHFQGTLDQQYKMWNLLMFQAWLPG